MGEFVFDHGWADAAERAGIRYFPKLLAGVPFTPAYRAPLSDARRTPIAPADDRACSARALIALCAENKLSSVHVNFCEAGRGRALAKLGFMERLGYQYHWRNAGFTTFDDYLDQLKSKRRYAVRHERGRAGRPGHRNSGVMRAMRFPIRCSRRCSSSIPLDDRQALLGTPIPDAEVLRADARASSAHLCLVCAFRGDELIAGTFNLQKAGRDVRALLGMLPRAEIPAFQRLLLRRDRALHRASACALRAGRRRRIQMAARLRSGADPQRAFHRASGIRKAVALLLARERREVEAWIAAGHEHSQLKAAAPSDAEQA